MIEQLSTKEMNEWITSKILLERKKKVKVCYSIIAVLLVAILMGCFRGYQYPSFYWVVSFFLVSELIILLYVLKNEHLNMREINAAQIKTLNNLSDRHPFLGNFIIISLSLHGYITEHEYDYFLYVSEKI